MNLITTIINFQIIFVRNTNLWTWTCAIIMIVMRLCQRESVICVGISPFPCRVDKTDAFTM